MSGACRGGWPAAVLALLGWGMLLGWCLVLGLAGAAQAGDCSGPSDCRAIPDNSNAALPVAAAGTGAAVGMGLRRRPRPPAIKPPKDYGPGRDNPFDPPVDEQQRRWDRDRLIWDPQRLEWRQPGPGEYPPPADPPEKPTPYQGDHPRDKTPVDCLDLYDRYVGAQDRIRTLEDVIKEASEHYWEAQRRHNANVAKFTLLLGWDVGSLLGGGVSGVHDAGAALRQAGADLGQRDTWKGPPGALGQALEAAKARLSRLLDLVRSLTDEMAQLGERVAALRQTAANLAESVKGFAAKVDELTGIITAAEERLAKAREWLGVARRVEALKAERNALAEKVLASEQRLQKAEAFWSRKMDLQGWAGMEKLSIGEQQGRLAMRLRDELAQVGKELDVLRNERLDAMSAASRGAGSGREVLEANAAKTAQLEARQGELTAQLSQTNRSWEEVAAEQDPEKFQAWKLEVEGTDPWTESRAELDPMRREVLDLRGQETGMEREINTLRDQMPPGASADGLESEAAAAEQSLTENRSRLDAARQQADGAKQQLDNANQALGEAETGRNAKEQQVRQAQQEAADAQTDVDRMQAGAPTPSLADRVKPQFVKDFEDGAKRVLGQVGKTWHDAFGGQSTDEIAQILVDGRDTVQRLLDELRARQAEYDQAMNDLRTVKPQLDQCVQQHTYYTGSPNAGAS